MNYALAAIAIIGLGALAYIIVSINRKLTRESTISFFRGLGCTFEPAMSHDRVPVPIKVIKYRGVEVGAIFKDRVRFHLFNKYNPKNTTLQTRVRFFGIDTEEDLASDLREYYNFK